MRQHHAITRKNHYKLFLMGRCGLFYPRGDRLGHHGEMSVLDFIKMKGQNAQDFLFLENRCNWIQYAFPTDGLAKHGDRDRFVLSADDIKTMISKDDQKEIIQTNLKDMLKTVMQFWGLKQKAGESPLQFELVHPGASNNLQKAVDRLCSNGYHNFARISRVLRSLELFGLQAEQKAVVEALPLLCQEILAKAAHKDQAKAEIQKSLHLWLLNIQNNELKADFKRKMENISLAPVPPVGNDSQSSKPSWTKDHAKKMLKAFAKQLDISLKKAAAESKYQRYEFDRVTITRQEGDNQEGAGLQTTADQGFRVKVTAGGYKRPKEGNASDFSFKAMYSPKTNNLTQVHFPKKLYTFDGNGASPELMSDYRCRVKLIVDALLSGHSSPVELELGNNTIEFSSTFIDAVKEVVQQNYPGFKLSKVCSKPPSKSVLTKKSQQPSSKSKTQVADMMTELNNTTARNHSATSNHEYYGYHG